MNPDIAIVGGGIAGLYTAYRVLKRRPNKRVIVLESKKETLGGRVSTFHNEHMDVEAGAGRIHSGHRLLLSLIRELGLGERLMKMDHQYGFMSSSNPGKPIHSVFEFGKDVSISLDHLGIVPEKYSPSKSVPYKELIAFLLEKSRKVSKQILIGMTFLEYAREMLNDETLVRIILDSFGYYSELVIMNAYDSLQLMRILDPNSHFYGLNGGLSQIIERLAIEIRKMGGQILMGHRVVDIQKMPLRANVCKVNGGIRKTRKLIRNSSGFVITCENGDTYWTKKCVCALPKQVIAKMGDPGNLFSGIQRELSHIECGSLCRIYCQFDKGRDGNVWFHNLGKLTVNNEIRMIIPIDVERGIIMISYTDNKWADEWNRIYTTEGIGALNRKLRDKVSSVVGYTIPSLKHTQVFYWKCGVGYWGKGADSRNIEKQVAEIQKGLFICGEHYSSQYQQWMEGALRTSSHVVRLLV